MSELIDTIKRLRVAGVTGVFTADLARAAVVELLKRSGERERQEWRDSVLQQVGRLMGGTRYSQAMRILNVCDGGADPNTEAAVLVRQVNDLVPVPTTLRRLLVILAEQ